LLYVVLTRAVAELYLISEYPKSQSINSHNEIIRSFLESSEKWRDDVNRYSWGKTEIKEKGKKEDSTTFLTAFETKHIQPKPSVKFLNDKIIFGNIFHEFMSKIEFESDYSKEKNELNLSSSVNKSIIKQVLRLSKNVIEHPDLKQYFSKKHTVYCEQEIFTKSKKIIKPDRLVFLTPNRVVLIDYKTGEKSKKDQQQILKYQKILEKMGYKIETSILVYVDNSVDLVNL
ncbi:hypothetical protein OAD59_04610, partial [Flavobacteriaceae bacterium]|nr:hypothetical protein [Flavobacteriaceae bacterium]